MEGRRNAGKDYNYSGVARIKRKGVPAAAKIFRPETTRISNDVITLTS